MPASMATSVFPRTLRLKQLGNSQLGRYSRPEAYIYWLPSTDTRIARASKE
jgi:hypothetical protein